MTHFDRPDWRRYLVTFVTICLALSACNKTDGTATNNGSADARDAADGGADDAADSDADPPPGDATDTPDSVDGSDAVDTFDPPVPEYPLSEEPYTTLQHLWAPKKLTDEARSAMFDGDLKVTDIDKFAQYGLAVEPADGQPWIEHNELAPGYSPGAASEWRSLLYFWESADPQLIDEESPIRFEGVTAAPFGSTYKPHSHVIPHVYESHVRSVRRISEMSGRPIDFVFIAGDMTDGGQENELGWTIDILNGGVIDPDSGVDDDPIPGEGNDFTDPFWSRGIDAPWYPAVGNHETLYSGLFPATDSVKQAAVGNEVIDFTDELPILRNIDGAKNGYRDASTPLGDVVTSGLTPADPRRQILSLDQVLNALQTADGLPVGHGLTEQDVFDEKGHYSFHPIEGKPVRFIVLNTLWESATAQGGIGRDQFDWLQRELQAANRADELVLIGSHHRAADLSSVLSPTNQGDLEGLLLEYDNVIAHITGHGHHNKKRLVEPSDTPAEGESTGYWEIMAPSTVQFPMQSRFIEMVYEGNGYLSLYVTNIEQNARPDTLAYKAFGWAVGRKQFTSNGYRDSWEGQRESMNLILRYKLRDDLRAKVEAFSWPERVESIETLLNLAGP
ncbi:MAG: hypothetical protein ACQEVA_07250 [Myxococcota bacterium]